MAQHSCTIYECILNAGQTKKSLVWRYCSVRSKAITSAAIVTSLLFPFTVTNVLGDTAGSLLVKCSIFSSCKCFTSDMQLCCLLLFADVNILYSKGQGKWANDGFHFKSQNCIRSKFWVIFLVDSVGENSLLHDVVFGATSHWSDSHCGI